MLKKIITIIIFAVLVYVAWRTRNDSAGRVVHEYAVAVHIQNHNK